jgi:hypothetical protein
VSLIFKVSLEVPVRDRVNLAERRSPSVQSGNFFSKGVRQLNAKSNDAGNAGEGSSSRAVSGKA